MSMEDVVVKLEPGWNLESAVSEAAALDWLYAGHQVKDELVVGPEVLQAPDGAYAQAEQDSSLLNTDKQIQGIETPSKDIELKDCVVMLERFSLDKMKQHSYISKLHTSFDLGKNVPKPKLKKVSTSQIHKKKTDFICSVCQKGFSSRSSLVKHKKIHTRDIASRKHDKDAKKNALKLTLIHEDIENKKISFGLKNCFVALVRINVKRNVRNVRFAKHSSTHVDSLASAEMTSAKSEAVKSKTHTCEICSREFRDKATLTVHAQTVHSEEKPHQCDICDRRFTIVKYLRKHKALHGKRRFKCEKCDKKFPTKSALTQHRRVHAEKQYSCNICDKKFRWENSLNQHKLTHTGENLHSCQECKIQFRHKKWLFSHMLKHSNGIELIKSFPAPKPQTYCCEICNKLLASKSNYRSHKLIHTGDKPLSCDICEKRFRLKSSLDRHFLIHTGKSNKKHSCAICEKKFAEKSALTSHMRVHTGEKPFTCGICEKRFRVKGDLKTHIRIHTGHRPFTCKTCDQRFITNSRLHQHERKHTIKKNKYLCEICRDSYGTKVALSKHIITHLTEVRNQYHVCDICNKVHKDKNSLIQHLRFHTGEKPYVCGTCPQRFTNSSDLCNHRQIHLQKNDLVCDPCVKGFNSGKNFIKHVMRAHTREKLYACEICALRFVFQGDLNEHKRCHTKDKYICDICQKSFTRKNTLIGHVRCHTGDKPYQCDTCPSKFSLRHHLTKHQETHLKKTHVCKKCKKTFKQRKQLLQHESCRVVNNPYACELCDKRYPAKPSLTRHIALIHK